MLLIVASVLIEGPDPSARDILDAAERLHDMLDELAQATSQRDKLTN
jgi:hypothetical protein